MRYQFQLCAGRHITPAAESIFPSEVNPLDMDWMYAEADAAIPPDATEIDLYVTGLTAATLAVVSVCVTRGISLRALHFNRDTGAFLPQKVLKEDVR